MHIHLHGLIPFPASSAFSSSSSSSKGCRPQQQKEKQQGWERERRGGKHFVDLLTFCDVIKVDCHRLLHVLAQTKCPAISVRRVRAVTWDESRQSGVRRRQATAVVAPSTCSSAIATASSDCVCVDCKRMSSNCSAVNSKETMARITRIFRPLCISTR